MALNKGEKHAMVAPELFKGASFLNLDMGVLIDAPYEIEEPSGRTVTDIETVDGEFQGEESFIHRIDEVRGWLAVEPIDMPDDLCIINFRGGEYVGVSDLFLPKEYWNLAIYTMLQNNPTIQFEVHTDDPITARRFFPDLTIVCDMEMSWRSIRYAKYLILSNSSFAILPALLNETVDKVIAPLYWAGYNKGYWQLEENNYKKFTYIHHENYQ
jgi:hypothetical protein